MAKIAGDIITDVDVTNIDLVVLQRYTARQMADWTIRNFPEIKQKTLDVCQELLSRSIPAVPNDGEPYPEPNPIIPRGDEARQLTLRSVPLCHMIPHIAALYQVSCQQFVFPDAKRMALRTATANLVRMAADLPDSDFFPILNYLREEKAICTNVLYTVKARTQEIASEKGESTESFAKTIYSCFYNYASVKSALLTDQPFEATDLIESDRVISGSTYAYVVALSMIEDVPMDYLLFQDYSNIAVWQDGTALTPRERDFLSAYLMAAPTAQTECLCKLCLLKLGRRV